MFALQKTGALCVRGGRISATGAPRAQARQNFEPAVDLTMTESSENRQNNPVLSVALYHISIRSVSFGWARGAFVVQTGSLVTIGVKSGPTNASMPPPRTKKSRTQPRPLQQLTLGFFEVPQSANVAVQQRGAKRKQNAAKKAPKDPPKRAKPQSTSTRQTEANKASSASVHRETRTDPPSSTNNEATATVRVSQNKKKESSPQDPEQKTSQEATPLPKNEEYPSALVAPPRNIALQLQQRSVRGLPSNRSTTPTIPWSTAPWLKLQCPRSGAPLSKACILEWDPMGVLLAVMTPDDAILRIYDWDTVSMSDAKGRNHRSRRKTNPDRVHTGGMYRIDATLHAHVRILGRNVRKLVWNPFDPDQIVILDWYVKETVGGKVKKTGFFFPILTFGA